MTSQIRPVLVLFAFLTLMTGVVYPFVVTGIGTALFADAAKGSLIVSGGQPIGSRLIGQNFAEPKYFWGRPSATATAPYNALASGGSNQGPLNPALEEAVRGRIEALRAADPANGALIPVDLITASASGLDPHISVAAAKYQVTRVANARGLPAAQIGELVAEHTSGRWLGLFGEPTVNVLALNLALDDIAGRVGG
jgi:K+-transporting ATPase ATPase C chain